MSGHITYPMDTEARITRRMAELNQDCQYLLFHADYQERMAATYSAMGRPDSAATWSRLADSTRREANFSTKRADVLQAALNQILGEKKCA
ncbi:MAG: hypothetical protein ABF430_05640 [Acetobacter persici]|uniref:hypothetical protein n=1 Tax=Acetobacter persici TaxID=1076596 RepID=UPI0039E9591D